MKKAKSLLLVLSLLISIVLPSMKTNPVEAATVVSLTSGVAVNGKLTKDSENNYQFTTNKDGQVYITLDQASAGFEIILYDASGNSITDSYFYNANDTATINEKLVKGTYRIKIKPMYWDGISSGSYRLKATYPGTITRDSKTYEPNDTYETSYVLKSGQQYNSKLENELDRDTYQFSTTKDGQLYLTLDQSTAGLSVVVYDSFGNYKSDSYFYTAGGSTYIDLNLKKGTYYAVVRAESWDGNTSANYRLKATFAGAFTRNTTNLEPNDTRDSAYQLVSGKSYTSNSFSNLDRDYFKFTTSRSGAVKLKLDKSAGGFNMELLDANGIYKDDDTFYVSGGSATIEMTLAKGTYYIKITPEYWDGISSSNYRLTTTFPDKTPTVNSVSNLSTTITGLAEAKAKVYAYAGSKLLGSTTAVSGNKYSIKIAKQKAGTKINVYIVDNAGIRSGDRYTTVLDKIPPAAPTVNKITSKSTTITGKTEASATVSAYNGSKLIGTAKADSKGNFKIKIKVQKKGSTIKVYSTDAAKNKSAARVVKVS
ncbi:Ig-like domain-containing protein [Gottfriedia sp. NPDC058432]|uniref:Ig-like domain-containing protein n=1 Tax=Gottfriedia sp. NPDC058432 TaxID=3346497 RepID=UPI00364AA6B7